MVKSSSCKDEKNQIKTSCFARYQLYDFGEKALNLKNSSKNNACLVEFYKAIVHSWVTSLREYTYTPG